jgi:hypothetical protein
MKRKTILLAMLVTTGVAVACDQYKIESEPYDYDRPAVVVPTPPTLDPSWGLEEMPNIGAQGTNVFVYKDKKYNALFTRTLGWNGGDGVFTTELPGGNTFWSFNDSFYGVVDGTTRARGSSSFPRNSLMVQKGESGDSDLVWLADFVQTTNPSGDRYYHARTHLRNPDATLGGDRIAAGDIDQDYVYWAGDATVYNNRLQMTWGAVDLTGGDGSMIRYKTAFAEYGLEGAPGDADYMKLLNVDHDFIPEDITGYGSTLFEDKGNTTDGEHIYLYTTMANGFNSFVLVARTETLDLSSQWSYYVGDGGNNYTWQTTYPTEEERNRSFIQNTQTCSMPWVFKDGDTYYMVFESYPFGREMYIARSDKPYGPFTDLKLLFTLPARLDKLGDPYPGKWYMVNLHTALSREGELVFSTNSDPANFWDNFNRTGSADFYRPYFFRVYNWKSLYEEDGAI